MTDYTPVYLLDRSILKSLYKLRVDAWSEYKHINHTSFPDGWHDSLDLTAHHWYIEVNRNIIASARLNIVNYLTEIPYGKVFEQFQDDLMFPLIFYSKLVIHPSYQKLRLSTKLDECRDIFFKNYGYKFSLITTDKPWRANKLKTKGWKSLGFVDPTKDKNWLLGESEILYKVNKTQK